MPAIAGRSPSYLIRQIYDMQVDARKGEWTQLMKPVVEKLNEDVLSHQSLRLNLPQPVALELRA